MTDWKNNMTLRNAVGRLVPLLLAMIGLCPVSAFASDVTLYDGTVLQDVTGVHQGTDGKHFASKMPTATIHIDPFISDRHCELHLMPNIDPGFYAQAGSITIGSVGVNDETFDTTFVVLDGTRDNATPILPGKRNEYLGDLFYFDYKDVAILSDNVTTANVRFTYSNLRLVTDTTENSSMPGEYPGAVTIAAGNVLHGMNSTPNIGTGFTIDVRMQVVDDQGLPIDGVFVYVMSDIDIIRRYRSNNVTYPDTYPDSYGNPTGSVKLLYDGASEEYYSESIRVNGGQIGDLYIPGGTAEDPNESNKGYKCYIVHEDGGIRFNPTVADYHVSPTYKIDGTPYSGFVTAVDNTHGISLTVWSAERGDTMFKSFLCAISVVDDHEMTHRIKSTTDEGGTITTGIWHSQSQRITDADANGKTYTISDGGRISYKMTPRPGYRIKSVTVSPTTINYRDGSEVTCEVHYVNDDPAQGIAYYAYTFSDVEADGAIHVQWEKDPDAPDEDTPSDNEESDTKDEDVPEPPSQSQPQSPSQSQEPSASPSPTQAANGSQQPAPQSAARTVTPTSLLQTGDAVAWIAACVIGAGALGIFILHRMRNDR